MTRLSLRRSWDGRPAPDDLGGDATFALDSSDAVLSWDLAFPEPLRVPPAAPGFLDGLWEHDVVELFLTREDPGAPEPSYLELEFGPGGHWLALSFRGIRRREAELRDLAPRLAGAVAGGRWRGSARLALASLAPFTDVDPSTGAPSFRGLACACTLAPDGSRLYLTSHALPGARADFHQPAEWPAIRAGLEAAPAR